MTEPKYLDYNLDVQHKDLVHDISFDFYGCRMATCSSDQSIKVWDREAHKSWFCTAEWKAHSGPVWKVAWAHPEFGQVLASASFDRTVAIWEEVLGVDGVYGLSSHRMSSEPRSSSNHWVKRSSLVDSRTSVMDVRFAPHHLGLMLATCSADGMVRIYEAPDIMNLSQWTLNYEINMKLSCSCISWSQSFASFHPPLLAIGCDDPHQGNVGKVYIYEQNEQRVWSRVESLVNITHPVHDVAFAPTNGRSHHLLGIASKDLRIISVKPLGVMGGERRYEVRQIALFEEHRPTVWRVSWNLLGTVLASSGDDGTIRMWKANYQDSWKCIKNLRSQASKVIPGSALSDNAPRHQATEKLRTEKVKSNKRSVEQRLIPEQVPWH